MTIRTKILAGTALGLLLGAVPASATPAFADAAPLRADAPVILAQARNEEERKEEAPAAEEAPAEAAPAEEAPAEAPAAKEAPAEEPAAQEAPAEEPAAEEPAAEEAPAEEPAAEEAPAEEPAAEEAPAEEPAAEEAPAEEPAAEEAPAEEPAAEEAPAEEPAAEEAPAEEPAAEEAPAEEPATEEAPAEEPAAEEAPAEEPAAEEAPAEEPAAEKTPAEEPAAEEAPAEEPAAEETPAEEPAAQEAPAEPAEDQPDAERSDRDQSPAEGEEAPAGDDAAGRDGGQGEDAGLPENAAPVLDSAKEAAPAEGQEGEAAPAAEGEDRQTDPADEAAEKAAPPPESDASAQREAVDPGEIRSIIAEEGRRMDGEERARDRAERREMSREERRAMREERRERRRERRERREDVDVVREYDDDRVIVEFNNHVYVQSPDYERIILDDDDVYYEELSNRRTREVIVRPDGVRVVTIRNRYGDVIRRSKIFPDDREVVLVYVPENHYDEVGAWRDPGADLPPLRLGIPASEYILEAETVEDPERYYTFLDQPPVDTIERTYSIDEVKRSARVRDTMRRVDLDTINFEFGSAELADSEIDEIEAIAQAMQRMLEENPGETFLIEGHTDAVGSEQANLVLSDRRAESVARALTNVFDIPPENLATQGYGEQYLKIDTEDRERENRRVAIRRITPLVAPVANAD